MIEPEVDEQKFQQAQRALKISAKGERGFMDSFGISLNAEQAALRGAGAAGEKQKIPA